MIQDGYITHGDFASPIVYWDMPSPLSSAIFVAVQTTFLSYQVTALFLDLSLGFKRRARTSAADMHVLLLTERASFSALISAVFQSGFLNRARRNETQKSPKFLSLIKVCALFLLAPVTNILSVFLTLEHDVPITFEEAQFGGAALGVNVDLSSVRTNPSASECRPLLFKSSLDVDPRFSCELCTSFLPERILRDFRDLYWIGVDTTTDGSVMINQAFSGISSTTTVSLDCVIDNWTYRVKPVIGSDGARALLRHATSSVQQRCISNGQSAPPVSPNDAFVQIGSDLNLQAEQVITCPPGATLRVEERYQVRLETAKVVTMVNAENFQISGNISLQDEDFSSFKVHDDLVMMVKASRNVSPVSLSIAVITVLILRVAMRLLTNNDVHEGIEAVMKSFLMVPLVGSTLLADDRVISYDCLQKDGENLESNESCATAA